MEDETEEEDYTKKIDRWCGRISESPWKYLNLFLLNSRPRKYLKTAQVLESPW